MIAFLFWRVCRAIGSLFMPAISLKELAQGI